MPTEKMAVGIWTVRMLTKLNNRVTKTIAQMDFAGSLVCFFWNANSGKQWSVIVESLFNDFGICFNEFEIFLMVLKCCK